jgi:hypothetical protein
MRFWLIVFLTLAAVAASAAYRFATMGSPPSNRFVGDCFQKMPLEPGDSCSPGVGVSSPHQ